jgi:hypothetical protein
MPVDVKEVFVHILVDGNNIVAGQFTVIAVNVGTPLEHQVGAELLTFLIVELVVEVSVLTIKLLHLVVDV